MSVKTGLEQIREWIAEQQRMCEQHVHMVPFTFPRALAALEGVTDTLDKIQKLAPEESCWVKQMFTDLLAILRGEQQEPDHDD